MALFQYSWKPDIIGGVGASVDRDAADQQEVP
jgi:hypothetical protein